MCSAEAGTFTHPVAALQMLLVLPSHAFDLSGDGGAQADRKHRDTILVPLPGSDDDLPSVQVGVHHAERAALHQPKPGAVQQANHQAVHGPIFHCGENPSNLSLRQHRRKTDRPLRPYGIELPEFPLDDVAKQEDEGIECLILRGRCDAATDGEVGKKRLDMLGRHVQRMDPISGLRSMESEEPLDPTHVGLLGSRGVVLGRTCLMNLIEKLHGGRMACEDTNVNM